MIQTNFEQTVGYGEDHFCEQARVLIKKACGQENADVHFLVGGTQANATVISAALKSYQGVVCAHTGHINVHETGAIEHGGHKVLAVPSENGKLSAEGLLRTIELHYEEDGPEHTVQPGMVYISFSTETGTIYSLAELNAIRSICDKYELPLFIDGARLGYGLASEGCDVTLQDIARLADVFYIGGTKQGALFGEAVVITNTRLKKDFRYYIKQNGGMLAKGRLLGIQFLTLFEDGLYFELASHAVNQALRIRDAFKKKGYAFLAESPSNQQFPILPNDIMAKLSESYLFSIWQKVDDNHTAVRFCTSWATRPEAVDDLIRTIENL
jgi:threonine aldolase